MKSKGKNTKLVFAAFAGSGLLLTVIQPPISLSFLAWIAYVPFVLVSVSNIRPSTLALAAYCVSLVYWLGNLYWIGFVTISGWIAFCAYTALLWPLLVFALRFCKDRGPTLVIAAPVLIVGAERLQGFLLGGFYWRYLAHSQYANIPLIQIADIFGAAGVSFVVALVNGLVAELIIAAKEHSLIRISNFVKTAAVAAVLAGAIFYGRWRIIQSAGTIEQGPIIAAVQSNLPQSVKDSDSFDVNKEVFQELLAMSKHCAEAGARLIVWPETIIPQIMDKGVWPFLYDVQANLFFDEALSEHARQGVYLLVGAPGGWVRHEADGSVWLEKFNSAFLYEPTGEQAQKKYDKIHLVPFGEVVPFRDSAPWLYNLLMKFSPYDFDYNLTPGTEYTVFEISERAAAQSRTYKFGVMICYEGTIPYIARHFALDRHGQKQLDWLVNISNDGWFVRFRKEKVHASTELPQHTIACVFRAVENRVSVLRSVNTGISCLVDSLGRIKNGYLAGDLPEQAMARKAMQGWLVDRVTLDTRVTFFSRFGQWLDSSCAVVFFFVLILSLSGRFFRKRQ